MKKKQGVSIIGTGALGAVLARTLYAQGFPIAGLYNRSDNNIEALKEKIKAQKTGRFPKSISELGDTIFITVPDDNIGSVVDQLGELSHDFSGHIAVHCSGSKPSAALSLLKSKGASVASFHPLQTFTASSNPIDLSGIYFDIEGDVEAIQFLEELAQTFGSQTLRIEPDAKPWLHAAAVMSSNYLLALLDVSSSIAEKGGLDKEEAQKALLPLVRQTLQNSETVDSLPKALSGPISRGDVKTVEEHLSLLEQSPDILALYKQLGLIIVKMSEAGNTISEPEQEKLLQLLNS
ncbi:MAG: DUF2520 domain-containing protein [Balneolaceae bacterium]|nr:DUF2520 domain-containing protein [Balneolaceae bacterium]